MILGLVWIIGCYAAGIAIIHTLHWQWKRRAAARTTHYLLRTKNNGNQVEWFLRSLHFFSWMKGRTIAVTLADEGSTDETLEIAERLSLEHHLNIYTSGNEDWAEWMRKHEHEQIVVVQLNQGMDLENAYKMI